MTAQDAYFRTVSQGSVLTCPAARSDVLAVFPPDTTRIVVVSQTCDVVLPADRRPTVHLAPVVNLVDGIAAQAKSGDMPRYVHLPQAGEDCFADLAYIHAIDKERLIGLDVTSGIDLSDDDTVRRFGIAVGRWFSRFAFPDDVVPWLSPLQQLIRDKYERPASPLGRALHDVVEFRVEAESWAVRPLDLTLHVIVRAGTFPQAEDSLSEDDLPDDAVLPEESVRSVPVVAEEISRAEGAASEDLWFEFARALAAACVPRQSERMPEVDAAVGRVSPSLFTDDEFPLSRIRKSELLDVDYLSAGYPL